MRVKLPGLMGRVIGEIDVDELKGNRLIRKNNNFVAIEHGRPTAAIIHDKELLKRIPQNIRPQENFDVAVLFEDTALFYQGDFERLIATSRVINDRVIWL